MAQVATNPKIEELRFRLKTDPKSRLFYQLAEELRKAGQFADAEQVLRSGLDVYPAYLAAWVSLGRVLREQKNDAGAVEALQRAMQLDPGNVVAARLLADSHLALGDKLEAIKKYKLVLALMPGDEELKAIVERLDRDLHPPDVAAVADAPVTPVSVAAATEAAAAPADAVPEAPTTTAATAAAPAAAVSEAPAFEMPAAEAAVAPGLEAAAAPPMEVEESPFDKTAPPFAEAERAVATGDAEPMLAAHEESPFEEPSATATAAAIALEQPQGIHVDPAPVSAELAAPVIEDEADIFAPAAPETATPAAEDLTNTLTMADLYARQGLIDEARQIYTNILARDPDNADVRGRLDALTPPESATQSKVQRLEQWLSRVSRKEVGRV